MIFIANDKFEILDLLEFKIEVNILFHENVYRHILDSSNRFLEYDMVTKCLYAIITLESRTLSDKIIHFPCPQGLNVFP